MTFAAASNTKVVCSNRNTDSRSQYSALLILIGFWVLTRGLLFILYSPQIGDDSPTYQTLANQIASLDFHDYNGFRTPGYPLLILLAFNNSHLIWIIQSILGLLTAILLFFIIRLYGANMKWAFAVAMLQLLALNQMFFEAMVLTETLSAFLLMLVCYLCIYFFVRDSKWWIMVLIGLTSALLILTRPQYLFIIPLFFLFFLFYLKKINLILIFLVFSMVPVMGWMSFNKEKTGYFSINNFLGYHLTNHSGAFIEHAPDEYEMIRNIYLKYREQKIAESGTHRMTIWLARNELRQATGLPEPQISHQFQQLSMKLFAEFPQLYIASVADAWLSFWVVPNYWNLDKLKLSFLSDGLKVVWKGQQILYRLFNLFFLILSVVLLWQLVIKRHMTLQQSFVPFLLTTVILGTSVIQSLTEYGENGRYSIPVQPLIVATVALIVADWVNRRRNITPIDG